ncbi:MAG: hypothetical protein WAK55_00165 [Xanthobacteraceae bacterium]
MSAPDDVPYFSRFVIKFLEILAAGLATAVSGYMIAHLAGALSSSTPAAVGNATQVAPSAGGVSSSPSAKPPAPASADAGEQHPVQEANTPADAQSVPGAEPSHEDAAKLVRKHLEADKHLETDTSAAAGATEGKRDQEANKHSRDAVLDRIRAALANSNAKRAIPPGAPQPPGGSGPRSAATIGSQPAPIDKRPGAASSPASVTLASPGSAKPPPQPIQQAVQPPIQQQVPTTIQQQPPTEPTPLNTVEIPSRPVATVQTAPSPPAASSDDTGMFSGLDRLRHDPLAASEDAPRPPMPVGQ